MMGSRSLVPALLVGGLLCWLRPANALGAPDAATRSFNSAIVRVADRLDAAATEARRSKHGKAAVPALQLPPAPLGGAPMYAPSLDQWLHAQLGQIRGEHSRKTQARELSELSASLRRVARPGGSEAPPARDPIAQAASILAQRPYQTGGAGPAPAPHKSLWERLAGWLQDRLAELFARIFGATASKPIIGQIFAVLFIALLASAAAYLIYLLASLLVGKRRSESIDEGTPLLEQAAPDALYELGMAAAGQGRYAQAIALLFQASLAGFDRAGKLPYDGSLTAGEYRRAVRRTIAAASPHFDAIAHAFVLAAFAERPISRDDWSAADGAYRSLRPLLAS